MIENHLEDTHARNIQRLIREFGDERAQEIQARYYAQRRAIETGASIYEFIPLFAYKSVREVFLSVSTNPHPPGSISLSLAQKKED